MPPRVVLRLSDILANLALPALALLILSCYAISILKGPINFDAGYYLPIVAQIADGAIPYVDIPMRYTPLGIYILSIPEWFIGGKVDFSVFQLIIAVFQILDLFLLFKISSFLKTGVKTRVFFCLGTLALQYRWGALFIELEYIYFFFVLLAVYMALLQKDSDLQWIFSGLCCALAFLCKQYGLMAIAPVGFLAISKADSKIRLSRTLSYISFGLILAAIAAYLLLVSQSQQISFLIFQLKGHGYYSGFKASFETIAIIINTFPVLLLLPFMLCKGVDELRMRLFVLVFLLATISPFLFKGYVHYFIPIASVCGLINIQVFSACTAILFEKEKNSKVRNILAFLGCVAVSLLLIFDVIYCCLKSNWEFANDPRSRQLNISREVNFYFPKRSTALCIADQSFYYLAELEPPINIYAGFVGDVSRGRFTRIIRHTDQILDDRKLNNKYYSEHNYLRNSIRRNLIRSAGFTPIATIDSRYTVWKRLKSVVRN